MRFSERMVQTGLVGLIIDNHLADGWTLDSVTRVNKDYYKLYFTRDDND